MDRLLLDENYRKTSSCSHFRHLLHNRAYPSFPTDIVRPTIDPSSCLDRLVESHRPLMVLSDDAASDLGLIVPRKELCDVHLKYITGLIGESQPIKVIEVGSQNEISDCTLGEYSFYLAHRSAQHKVLNMITLEFSSFHAMNLKVQSPLFVRHIDWIDLIWPLDRRVRGDYPKVQKYCLAGMADSYTDFHVDFGGTSVWYHVLHGRKRFYLIPPLTANLLAFERWNKSSQQSDQFFADLVPGQCFLVDIGPGETFLIPGGWIHAVYTPEDALVFGGNFVTTASIVRQLQVFEIEERTKVRKIYRFPFFRQINWYFLCSLLKSAKKLFVERLPMCDVEMEEDEDVLAVCNQLRTKSVTYQLPYLLKACELWWSGGKLEASERDAMQRAVQLTDRSSHAEVIDDWWRVVGGLSKDLGCDAADHSQRIQLSPTLDLLDDGTVHVVFKDFEQELCRHMNASGIPYTIDHDNETPQTKTETAVELGQDCPIDDDTPLMLRLSVTKPTNVISSSQDTSADPHPVPIEEEGEGSQCGGVPVPVVEGTTEQRRNVKFCLSKKKEKDAPECDPPPNASKAVVTSSIGGVEKSRPYGTRGLKLSADFLRRTMDVDTEDMIAADEHIAIEEEEQEDYRKSPMIDEDCEEDANFTASDDDLSVDGTAVGKRGRLVTKKDARAIRKPHSSAAVRVATESKPPATKKRAAAPAVNSRHQLMKKLGLKL